MWGAQGKKGGVWDLTGNPVHGKKTWRTRKGRIQMVHITQVQGGTEVTKDMVLHMQAKRNRFPFAVPGKESYLTRLCFPPVHGDRTEKQAQQENYEAFIRTVADMVQKYAPELMKEMKEMEGM